jgi:hypothetical protein
MLYNEDYEFGYARYDSNGNYDGVRHGWNTMNGDEIFEGGGYVIFKFRRTDKGDIIPELDIPWLSDGVIEITTEGGLGYLDHKIEDVDAKVGDISTVLDAILAKQNAVIGGV